MKSELQEALDLYERAMDMYIEATLNRGCVGTDEAQRESAQKMFEGCHDYFLACRMKLEQAKKKFREIKENSHHKTIEKQMESERAIRNRHCN